MQELVRIGKAAKDGSLAKAAALTELISQLKSSGGTCHLVGLMSPGGVHSHQDHAIALAKILTQGRCEDDRACADGWSGHPAAVRGRRYRRAT